MPKTSLVPLSVTVADAADLLDVSRRTVESLVHHKRLQSRKLGKRRLILYADLQRLLRNDLPRIAPGAAEEQ